MKNILNLKFCVWGTGRYGNTFLSQLKEYSYICRQVFGHDIIDNIEYFVDSSIEKQQLNFYNKSIISPSTFFCRNKKFCVIAVSDRKNIFDVLDRNQFKKNVDYVSYEIFINEIKKEILRQRKFIFVKYNLTFPRDDGMHFCDLLNTIKESFDQLIKDGNENDNTLKYIIFSLVIEQWRDSNDKVNDFDKMREHFDDKLIVAAYAWYFEINISEISECFSNHIIVDLSHHVSKQTIGIVVRNYFGGGIEKTVSLLISIYAQHGHKVVLITDSCVPDKEYGLPLSAIRYIMSNVAGNNKEKRLEELEKCVTENKIDIMCFHSGYTEIATFYEMWYLKLLHIPVLMEVHSAFFPIITTKKEISQYYPDMYKMADQLIVLSNIDKIFWESLSCQCKYIQNPIEENYIQTEYIYNSRDTKTIVWIGRLVQNPKRILDVVPIMEKVIRKIPEARLKIVGLATEPLTYQLLIHLISEKRLEENIELCGYKQDISMVYKDADVVLMTSESESFCNVIMESKLSGKPIVMYEMPWLELLKDGRGYIAVRQKDTEAAANSIVNILSDDEMRKNMSIDAYESIKPFIKHNVYQAWKDVFNDITTYRNKTVITTTDFSIIIKKMFSVIYEDMDTKY